MKTACAARNGSYSCHRTQGHSGWHYSKTKTRSLRGIRFASWVSAYGPVRFSVKGER